MGGIFRIGAPLTIRDEELHTVLDIRESALGTVLTR